ncbi:DUF2637 domain-containing protein [Streptomyces sp. NPDC001380]|uniref:DUF2637 domain-containing protein n=1 Tax=Streptomyces sp. NPDC001380 TaxID=3364566 RepID=UPI0036B0EDE1
MYDTRETYLPYRDPGAEEYADGQYADGQYTDGRYDAGQYDAGPHVTVHPQAGWYADGPPADPATSYRPLADLLDAAQDPAAGLLPPLAADDEDTVPSPVAYDLPRRRRPVPHRRRRPLPATWSQLTSSAFGVLTTCTVTAVSLLGWAFAYAPLQRLAAAHVGSGLAGLWPVIIYGPWFVASLSILRAALERRRIAHSWVVLGVFSGMAAVLCVASAAATPADVVVAGLPPVTAVVSFHQLVRQMTATRRGRHGPVPPPAAPRPKGARR